MISNFKEKLNNLPQEMQDYFLSEYGMSLEDKIYEKYNLTGYSFSDFSDTISLLYFGELKLKDLVVYIHNNFYVTNDIATKIAADIVGMRVLIVKQFFKEENVEQYLKNTLQVDVSVYNKYLIRAKEELRNERMGYKVALELEEKKAKELEEEKSKDVFIYVASDPKKEMEDSLNLFTRSVKILLKAENDAYLNNYNKVLVEMLVENTEFKKNLERCLLNNEEIITKDKIVIEGRPYPPEARNWIRDFVVNYGSGLFNNIVLSAYLGESENAKKLNEEEKLLVRRLLTIYRNLKFFPESFKNVPTEKWQIIPVDEGVPTNELKARENKRKEIERAVENIDIDSGDKNLVANNVNKAEEDPNSKRIKELEAMKETFEEGSLEHLAINEEINKVKRS